MTPSIDKTEIYRQSMRELESVLESITEPIAVMATISCILKMNLPHYYWAGFYRVHQGALIVGPYQGTLGCLTIEFGRGVCGTCAAERQTQIVPDVHAFPGHIACDARTKSEIVVPVFDPGKELIAVFDVDSTEPDAFDETDRDYLETIMKRYFSM
jgi:GAF domain-containing protein